MKPIMYYGDTVSLGTLAVYNLTAILKVCSSEGLYLKSPSGFSGELWIDMYDIHLLDLKS